MSKTLTEQAQEILAMAEEAGVESNFYFVTTFKRYQVQLNILTELETAMKREGAVITKGGRSYANPAIAEYNRTATAANSTVATLKKLID